MPTPAKTSATVIIAAARDLIAGHGLDTLTMQSVAGRVGVQCPSLYKHFADRAALLNAIELTVVADLEQAIAKATATKKDDKEALRAIGTAYRRFARDSPAEYRLLFRCPSADSDAARHRALQPALQRLESNLGDAALAVVRARVLSSFLHGFVSMEAAGAFGSGRDVSEAFDAGVNLCLKKPKLKKPKK